MKRLLSHGLLTSYWNLIWIARQKQLLVRVLVVTVLMGWAASGAAQQQSPVLFQVIGDRLGYMQDVASYKAANMLPVEDLEREKIVLNNAVEKAASAGLQPASVAAFFEMQIVAAKAIQYRYRAELLSMPGEEKPRDLQSVVRPRLLELGDQIIELMAADLSEHGAYKETHFSAFSMAVNVSYLSDREQRLLFDALQRVRLSASQQPADLQ